MKTPCASPPVQEAGSIFVWIVLLLPWAALVWLAFLYE